jgi:hypothetical protein
MLHLRFFSILSGGGKIARPERTPDYYIGNDGARQYVFNSENFPFVPLSQRGNRNDVRAICIGQEGC